MSKKQKAIKVGKIGKIITYVAIVLAIVMLCGVLVFFTNGFTTDFQTFYVKNGDKVIVESGSGYKFSSNKTEKFDVVYMFGEGSETASGYSLKIVPNTTDNTDFDFTVNGDVYSFSGEDDLTSGFDINYQEDYFEIKPKGDINEVFQAIYSGKTVSDVSTHTYKDMFALIVTSYNGKSSVTIYFYIDENVTGVILDKEVINF